MIEGVKPDPRKTEEVVNLEWLKLLKTMNPVPSNGIIFTLLMDRANWNIGISYGIDKMWTRIQGLHWMDT